MTNHSGLHHIHKRKRASKKVKTLFDYPSDKKFIRILDKFLIFIAIIGPLMALPQILKLYISQEANGLSFTTFMLYSIMNLPWILYSFVHRDKPLLITSILWLIANSTIAIGIWIY
jgi:uncharacterized protein with PQ loop repeat